MAQLHELRVSKLVKETADAVSIFFEIPTHLAGDFDYEPGQYLTVEIERDGRSERRAYSLSSSPLWDMEPSITVKEVSGGFMSVFLNRELKENDALRVLTPMGKFTPSLDERNAKHYVLFGAGSGITPLLSIIKSILHLEPKSRISLLYGNKNQNSVIFKDELDRLSTDFSGRLEVIHTLSNPDENWSGMQGRIDTEKCMSFLQNLNDENHEYFICGPGSMIATVEEVLLAKGVKAENIYREYFTPKSDEKAAVVTEFNGSCEVTVVIENEEHHFQINDDTSVLDAAINAGVDAPYSCKIAACCTCQAKIIEGAVEMDDSDILTDKEIEAGFILTCQSHPKTERLKISYD